MKFTIGKNIFLYYFVLLTWKSSPLIRGERTAYKSALLSLKENRNTDTMQTSLKPLNQSDILLQEIKENFIEAFGLRKTLLAVAETKEKRQPHNYMLYMTQKFQKMVDDGVPTIANTVRGCSDMGEERKGLANYPHLAFKFDVSEIPSSETLVSSELKVLMKTPKSFQSRNTLLQKGIYKVSLFGVIPRKYHVESNKHGHNYPILLEINSHIIDIVPGQENRWITFDVSAFLPIVQGKKKFIKFVLRVKPLNGGTVLDPKLLGIESYQNEETNKALLVIFTGDRTIMTETPKARNKRSISSDEDSKKSKDQKKLKNRKNRKNKHKRRNRKGCRKKNMIVNFDDLGWSAWLFSPKSYNAFYCQGSCKYPVAQHLKVSNHATIQSIVNSINKDFVPPPCCVPSKTKPLPFLLLDGEDRMVIRYKKDVIVTECGCR